MKKIDHIKKMINEMSGECKIFVEIGVFKGKLTKAILENIESIETYYCVDPWAHYPEWDNSLFSEKWKNTNFDAVYRTFNNKIKNYSDKVNVLRMKSSKASKLIMDESVDMVFIDGNHSYEYVKEDIELWLWKIRKGGILSGHDYHEKYGVKQAVDEMIENVKILERSKIWYKRIGDL